MHLRADRIPFEGHSSAGTPRGNGNLAQLLQEPTLMGAYEGAGITVLGRGVRDPGQQHRPLGARSPAPRARSRTAAVYLTNANADCTTSSTTQTTGRDYGTANFQCNPSRIDGCQHHQQLAGRRRHLRARLEPLPRDREQPHLRQPRHADGRHQPRQRRDARRSTPTTARSAARRGTPTPLCPPFGNASLIGAGTPPTNAAIPFQLNVKTRVHHNMIANNASIGDALFSGTPSGAGGITISAGADNYRIDHNWIAGNLSTGDGGGLQHTGPDASTAGSTNNWILFNQSTNPTLPTNGGGIVIAGAEFDRTLPNGSECGTTSDIDCPPGHRRRHRPSLVIDANLIMGNSAESGSGGGMRLQQVNGTEVVTLPLLNSRSGTTSRSPTTSSPTTWPAGTAAACRCRTR